jgi:acetolactate decarboxylase
MVAVPDPSAIIVLFEKARPVYLERGVISMVRQMVAAGSGRISWNRALIEIMVLFNLFLLPASAATWDGRLAQYGEMRQVLGQGRDQGRVRLGDMVQRPHCYAVGALAELAGEVTIVDGRILVTRAVQDGQPATGSAGSQNRQATMLVAAYVPEWTERQIAEAIAPDALERFLRQTALEVGLDVSKPFPFVIQGPLIKLEGHVINGACPMRAKRLGQKLPEAQQPFRGSFARTTARLVGIYAPGAEHRLTHHGTETHTHAVLETKEGQTYTVHVERAGVGAGARLRLPAREKPCPSTKRDDVSAV